MFFLSISCDVKSQSKPALSQSANSYVRKEKVQEIKNFVKGENYNQDFAFFIDFKMFSGKYRFFVYDLKNDKILEKAIVSHGSGSVIPNSSQLAFSNIENSYQSSLGKYEVLGSYVGNFGKSYRLKGLDATNSKALKRAIVLHTYYCIGDEESDKPACLSLGCPMLSKKFFHTLENYIDQSKKPIILFAYY